MSENYDITPNEIKEFFESETEKLRYDLIEILNESGFDFGDLTGCSVERIVHLINCAQNRINEYYNNITDYVDELKRIEKFKNEFDRCIENNDSSAAEAPK